MWGIYNKLCAPNKMPFTSKYSNLGKTTKVRIPESYMPHIEHLLEGYDRICGAHNEEFLHKIQKNIQKGLDSIE
jgi:transcription-repair coupling factor (superfamily II helicase)